MRIGDRLVKAAAGVHLACGVRYATIGGESIEGEVTLPGSFRPLCFAAVLVATALVGTGSARAEMTGADEAGMRAFAACLDETGNDEDACTEKLGRYAWYPHGGATCETVGARVERVIDLEGQVKWRDLFMNERCARLDLPHNQTAAVAEITRIGKVPYFLCGPDDGFAGSSSCGNELSRHFWHPWNNSSCRITMHALMKDVEGISYSSWDSLFKTERCHRLGMDYFQPERNQ